MMAINEKKIFNLTCAVYLAAFLFYWIYSFQYDWDTITDIIFLQKFQQYDISRIHPHSPLLGILLFPLSGFIDPLYSIIFLSCISLIATAYLFKNISSRFVSEKISILTLIVFFSSVSFYKTALKLDDNFFQIPILLLIFKLVIDRPAKYYNAFLTGILLSLTICIHIQAMIFIPLLAAAFFYKSDMKKTGDRIKLSFLCLVSTLIIFLPIALMLITQNHTGICNELTRYFTDKRFSTLAATPSLQYFFNLIPLYIVYLAVNIAPLPLYSGIPLDALICIADIAWLIFFFATALSAIFFKKNSAEKFFIYANSSIIILSMTFNFLYEPISNERWCTSVPFFYLLFSIGIQRLINFKEFKIIKLAGKNYALLALFSIITSIFIINFKFTCESAVNKTGVYIYPNRTTFSLINENVDKNAPLIMGFDIPWLMMSYLRPEITVYQNDFYLHSVQNGIFCDFKTIDDFKKYIQKYNVIYFHECARPFIEKNFKDAPGKIELHKVVQDSFFINNSPESGHSFKIFSLRVK